VPCCCSRSVARASRRYRGSVAITIRRVKASETFPLRQRVLRPHQTVDEMSLPGDDDADTGHFAAVEDGEVVGTASVRRETAPWAPDLAPAWRLRGMATAEGRRSQGVGAALVAAVVEHVRGHGGGLLWCNARMPAVSFYQRAGFVIRGESWVDPIIGPHIAMEKMVEIAAP
jgi:GNAT superfamily N-acetyltransferase